MSAVAATHEAGERRTWTADEYERPVEAGVIGEHERAPEGPIRVEELFPRSR
jgi:hypothetical protein